MYLGVVIRRNPKKCNQKIRYQQMEEVVKRSQYLQEAKQKIVVGSHYICRFNQGL